MYAFKNAICDLCWPIVNIFLFGLALHVSKPKKVYSFPPI